MSLVLTRANLAKFFETLYDFWTFFILSFVNVVFSVANRYFVAIIDYLCGY